MPKENDRMIFRGYACICPTSNGSYDNDKARITYFWAVAVDCCDKSRVVDNVVTGVSPFRVVFSCGKCENCRCALECLKTKAHSGFIYRQNPLPL